MRDGCYFGFLTHKLPEYLPMMKCLPQIFQASQINKISDSTTYFIIFGMPARAKIIIDDWKQLDNNYILALIKNLPNLQTMSDKYTKKTSFPTIDALNLVGQKQHFDLTNNIDQLKKFKNIVMKHDVVLSQPDSYETKLVKEEVKTLITKVNRKKELGCFMSSLEDISYNEIASLARIGAVNIDIKKTNRISAANQIRPMKKLSNDLKISVLLDLNTIAELNSIATDLGTQVSKGTLCLSSDTKKLWASQIKTLSFCVKIHNVKSNRENWERIKMILMYVISSSNVGQDTVNMNPLITELNERFVPDDENDDLDLDITPQRSEISYNLAEQIFFGKKR